MMDDSRLDEILRAARERPPSPSRPFSPPGCVLPARVRELVLDPSRATPVERDHTEHCPRCRSLVASIERNMPHPSLWLLLRRELGRLSDEAQRVATYHLEDG